jgi:hypothetical protein
MTIGSFNKLLELLSLTLQLNETFGRVSSRASTACEIMLQCAIDFFAGGSVAEGFKSMFTGGLE